MFDYTRKLKLAASDKLRRAGLGAGGGVALLVAAGFLTAALWTWLAYHLGWGALGASLALGLGFLLVGVIAMVMAGRERHPVPTTEDLKTEVQERLTLAADMAMDKATGAADAALERASQKASQLMGRAEQRVHSMADSLTYKADRLADRTEARVYGAVRRAGESAASSLGLPPDALKRAAGKVRSASHSRVAVIAPLIGAFAVGMTLASRLQARGDDDLADPGGAGDWGDDPY